MSPFEGRNKKSKKIIMRGNQGFLVVYYYFRLNSRWANQLNKWRSTINCVV
jgi:hypothetical protein